MERWNYLCNKVDKNRIVREMTFEKDIAKGFLSSLGWDEFKGFLKEQYVLPEVRASWKPDFALFVDDKVHPEIVVELKRPSHKQKKEDIIQILSYLRVSDCRFGIYFGEKLELFYLTQEEKRQVKCVLTVDYVTNSADAKFLMTLIEKDKYRKSLLVEFCEEQLMVDKVSDQYSTKEGISELFDYIIGKHGLSAKLGERLRSVFELLPRKKHVSRYHFIEDETMAEKADMPQNISESNSGNTMPNDEPRYSSLSTLKSYYRNLNSEITRKVMRSVGLKADISEISDVKILLRLNESIKTYERVNGIHHTHSCAVSKYIDYLQHGFTYKDFEHDARLVRKGRTIAISTDKKNKPAKEKGSKRRSSFTFSMVGLKEGDSVVFDQRDINVTVSSDKTVLYQGKEYSLSGFCKEFLPADKKTSTNTYQGPKYFSYQGKTLWQMRLENE